MVAAVLIGGFAYFYLTSNTSGDTAAAGESTLAANTDESEAAPDETVVETNPAGADTSTDSDDATANETDDEAESTTTSSATTTATALSEVDGFRAILEENGLTSESLTDNQIRDFATDFCERARSSDDAEDFVNVRDEAISAANTRLSSSELTLVINTAVITFCPEEATRLSITP
jgi:hypothetical protein